MNKKGSIQQLFPSVLALILAGVLLGVGLIVMHSFSDSARLGGVSTGNATMATNATDAVVVALGTLASTWLPIIVVVIAAGIVLGVLLGAFGGGRRR